MQGRLEHTKRNENNAEMILKELPDCVGDYYYSRINKESKGNVEYLRKIRNFLKFNCDDCRNIDITKITERDIAKYLKHIETRKDKNGKEISTSFSYRKQVYTILNSFFEYLRKKKFILKNPMECIERPVSKDKIKRVILDEFDLQDILDSVDEGAGTTHSKNRQEIWKERDRAIIFLFINTGMRETALTEINVEDLDFVHNRITVVDKRHKTHVYIMNEKLKNILCIWLNKREELLNDRLEDALFISNRRTRISEKGVVAIVAKYSFEGLGYKISPHKLRAAFCTILYNRTGDIEKVRDAVGHNDISTTQRYIVKDESARLEASLIMEDIFD